MAPATPVRVSVCGVAPVLLRSPGQRPVRHGCTHTASETTFTSSIINSNSIARFVLRFPAM